MTATSIGVLGGGSGGVVVANLLRKALPQENDVVLVERETDHYFPASYLWALTGKRRPEQLHRPLDRLTRKGIDVVTGEIESIEPATRTVVVDGRPMQFDYLVISLGARLRMDALPGLAECRTFYTFEGTRTLLDALRSFRGGPILITMPSMPYKCPAAPYEAAFLVDELMRRRGLRERSPIEIVTVEPQPMPVAGPLIGGTITGMLASREIGLATGIKLTGVDHNNGRASFEGAEDRPFALAIAVPPHAAPSAVAESGMCDETGWVPVDSGTMATRHENVYAIGDVTAIKLPNGKFLPKAGVFAHYQAEVVAANIAAAIRGRERKGVFEGRGQCFLEVGHAKAGYASGEFYARPDPDVRMRKPSVWNHWAKVWFEKYWWWRWL